MKTTLTDSFAKVLPVLFGFFIMGFVDVVGISTSYVKIDFNLSETLAGFIPSMVFFWFLLLSIPTAGLMNRIGRKRTVQISNLVTIIGMTIPFLSYNFYTCMVAFALLGIGNTILQVSLNPLLTNVVKGEALTSSLTVGQVVKAVSSFCGPFIAAFAAKSLGSWQYLFPIFAGVSLLSAAWLMATTIKEEAPVKTTNMGAAFSLLKKKSILLCFLAIVFVVGVDVGMNTVAPKLLMERAGAAVENAGFASSVYFFCRTVGALIGAILLARMSDMKYYRIHVFIALVALLTLYFMQEQTPILVMIGIIGYACSSLFAVIFSQVIKAFPERVNDVSGLMITGIFGGAIAPPLMGYATDSIGNQTGSLLVISACLAYLVIFAFVFKIAKR
jgi:fucose permease